MNVDVNVNWTGLQMLQVALIVLKLIGEITWSWWWVLSPLWITTVVAGLVLGVVWSYRR